MIDSFISEILKYEMLVIVSSTEKPWAVIFTPKNIPSEIMIVEALTNSDKSPALSRRYHFLLPGVQGKSVKHWQQSSQGMKIVQMPKSFEFHSKGLLTNFLSMMKETFFMKGANADKYISLMWWTS